MEITKKSMKKPEMVKTANYAVCAACPASTASIASATLLIPVSRIAGLAL